MSLQPILLASTGRAGSSLAMKILSSHPQIVVRSLFPYETRSFQYYYIASQQQEKKIDFLPLNFLNAEYVPCQGNDRKSLDWQHQYHGYCIADNGYELTSNYYNHLANIENKNNPIYFAEKAIGLSLLTQIAESFPTSKIIFLKRDPRDTFLSIKSFNQKRQFVSFGEEAGDEILMRNLIIFYKRSQELQDSLGKRAIGLQYERAIESPQDTIECLLHNLELDSSHNLVETIVKESFADSKETIYHKTSSSTKDSVNRWQREMNESWISLVEQFQKDLENIGY